MERRVVAMTAEGIGPEEIGRRLRRSSDHVQRVLSWTAIPRRRLPQHEGLSPKERRVLAMRNAGLSYEEIGRRFRHSPEHIKRIEGYAGLREDLGIA
ncbi:MAG TPA: sigma factor-like helix-turn-helix DNA-binding protein [Acidimicrobiia bacterium]|nr:sigma factor-like helix-turn-helix DNA-binding protein [Acidimicrobiia bacterium]